MVDLVSLPDVKAAQPVIDHEDDDDLLQVLIEAASQAVIAYLGAQAREFIGLDDEGELMPGAKVPPVVRIATILTARHLYQPVEKLPDIPGALPRMAVSLLYRHCDPPLA